MTAKRAKRQENVDWCFYSELMDRMSGPRKRAMVRALAKVNLITAKRVVAIERRLDMQERRVWS